jgi:hypothetical protein
MAATLVDDLCTKFRAIWLSDPIMVAMERGTILWGDIPMSNAEQEFHKEWALKQVVVYDETDVPVPTNTPVDDEHSSSAHSAPVFVRYDEEAAAWSSPKKPTARIVPPAPATKTLPTGRATIITRNLPRSITVEQLRAIFEQYGPIKDVYIPKNMDKTSPYFGTIKGFALIKFLKPEHSAAAYQAQYGRLTIAGNNISVEFAKEDR